MAFLLSSTRSNLACSGDSSLLMEPTTVTLASGLYTAYLFSSIRSHLARSRSRA
ncbi:hypothetical protein OBBRIDRAFT_790456 [Obba rivulosa]|uniref:Uncharacterized protein n=1 Tax=Obba rivulosa TaxID=1052685 RepID=A0A8E2J2E7_9APHY|nr:hypothetical protein OBBRIDRAFT_790456 [Obba rivulosa]